jgi:DNA-binding MarR family transcriptional regulator
VQRLAGVHIRERGTTATLEMLQAIWALAHGLQVRSRRMSRDFGVTGPQRLVMRLVATGQATTPGELADRLVLHKSTVTGILARLERRRLIARARHASDARRVTLTVTPAGERVARSNAGTIEAVVEQVIGRVSRAELESARAFMTTLAVALASSGRSARQRKAPPAPR